MVACSGTLYVKLPVNFTKYKLLKGKIEFHYLNSYSFDAPNKSGIRLGLPQPLYIRVISCTANYFSHLYYVLGFSSIEIFNFIQPVKST